MRSDKKTYSKDKLVGSALRRKARLELQLSALNVSSLASTRALTRVTVPYDASDRAPDARRSGLSDICTAVRYTPGSWDDSLVRGR